MANSTLETAFAYQAKVVGLPAYEQQYRLAAITVGLGAGVRKRLKDAGLQDWRFDFAWPDRKLLVELNGGTFINGRHNRGSALKSEYKKWNHAQSEGFNVLIFDSGMVTSGEAVNQVEKFLCS